MQDKHLLSDWLFGALLTLYPVRFRSAYGESMRLAFRDACRAAYHRGGRVGLLALWLPTLLDLLKSVLEERAQQGEITMSQERLMAWSGPLMIIVGLLWLLAAFFEFMLVAGITSLNSMWDPIFLIPFSLSFYPMLPALLGLRLRTHAAASFTGRFGLILSVAGCVGMLSLPLIMILVNALVPPDQVGTLPDYVTAVCKLCIIIGQVLFGVDALRFRLLPRWNFLPLLSGLAILPLLVVITRILMIMRWSELQIIGFTSLELAIFGVCWVLMGFAMAGQQREPSATAPVAPAV
jgi:hypothetical protein